MHTHTHSRSRPFLSTKKPPRGVVAYLLWDPSGYFFGEEQS